MNAVTHEPFVLRVFAMAMQTATACCMLDHARAALPDHQLVMVSTTTMKITPHHFRF